MEKPADTQYPIHDLLKRRWSPRAFSERPVEPDALRSLLEAARWAPSSSNEQPWSFIVATRDNEAEHGRLVSCLVDGNVPWAQRAPVLMVSVARMSFEDEGKPNRHAFHDVGQAVADLSVQATALGYPGDPENLPEKFRSRESAPRERKPLAEFVFAERWGKTASIVTG